MSEETANNEEFAQLEAEINDEQPQPGQQIENQPQAPETSEVVQQLLTMGFAVLAPAWNVTEPEIEQLSLAYGPLVDKYFPEGLGDHGLEVNAIMITAAVVLPRIRQPRKIEQQPKKSGGEDATPEK